MTTDTDKPQRPSGKRTEPRLTPDEQKRRFRELCDELGTDSGETRDMVFGKIVPPKARTTDKQA